MSFLAASLSFLLISQQVQPQERFIDTPLKATNPYQSAAWSSIVDSVAVLPDSAGNPFGLAILIDDEGYFVAHISSLVTEPLNAKMSGGLGIKLNRVGFDKETQLVLLSAEKWESQKRMPLRLAPETKIGELMVATAKGPVPAQLTSLSRPGLFLPSMRFVPLAEIQMEAKDVPVGGGIVFDNAGNLVGILGAVLNPQDSETQEVLQNVRSNSGQFGPAGLTVGYALGPKILSRVVEGFRRPDHQVQHPSVGIFFKEGGPGQIVVDDIASGSPCENAGVQKGDLVIAANGTPLGNVVDFAALLFELEPGEELILKLYRNGTTVTCKMVVGVQSSR